MSSTLSISERRCLPARDFSILLREKLNVYLRLHDRGWANSGNSLLLEATLEMFVGKSVRWLEHSILLRRSPGRTGCEVGNEDYGSGRVLTTIYPCWFSTYSPLEYQWSPAARALYLVFLRRVFESNSWTSFSFS
jgi:hypothetical protein